MLILKKQRNSTDSPVNGLVSHSEWIRGHEDRRTYCGWRNAESEAYQRALCRPIGRCQARAGELVAAPIRKKRSRPGGGIWWDVRREPPGQDGYVRPVLHCCTCVVQQCNTIVP